MSKTRWLLASLASLLASCATTGPAEVVRIETKIIDTACQWVKPIWIDRDGDVLTDGTADQIRAHNETGASRCHWQSRR